MIDPAHPTMQTGPEEWETPKHLFDEVDREFGFTLDACATPENALCDDFITREQDALSMEWSGVVWMNPPYGKSVTGRWVAKAWAESRKLATVVCLIPARTDTAYWHDYVLRGEVRYIKQRLRFSGSKQPAPFPSVIVIFRCGVDVLPPRTYQGFPAKRSVEFK